MGATLCNDTDTHSLLIDPQDMANLYDFQPGSWPNDPHLMKLLQNSSIAPGELKTNPYSHKNLERYYWGGWAFNKPYGKGIYYTSTNPNQYLYYEGEVDGEPNGRGKLVFNGSQWIYEGQINNGQPHGRGKMLHNKQFYQFEGYWLNSRPVQGKYILHYQNSPQQTENNKSSQLKSTASFNNKLKQKYTEIIYKENSHQNVINYANGCTYIGQIDIKSFLPDGFGRLVYPNRNQYIGQWHQGKMHGVGKFQWSDGACYSGDYLFGKRQGNGKIIFNNKSYYQGQWSHDIQNGQGVLYSKQGQILKKGFWRKGNFIK